MYKNNYCRGCAFGRFKFPISKSVFHEKSRELQNIEYIVTGQLSENLTLVTELCGSSVFFFYFLFQPRLRDIIQAVNDSKK